MSSDAVTRTAQLGTKIALAASCMVVATVLSFVLVRELQRPPEIWRSATPGLAVNDSVSQRAPPSGRYLVAYVLLSSECGFCMEPQTRAATARVRRTLASHRGQFADISVVGIVMDRSLAAANKYVRSLGRDTVAFDQLVVGGGWLNEQVVRMVWQGGIMMPLTPQVVLVERHVDMTSYPRTIGVSRDSTILKVLGRVDLIEWVALGAPLQFTSSSATAPASPVDSVR